MPPPENAGWKKTEKSIAWTVYRDNADKKTGKTQLPGF
jgi:hypothetical protein